jgi:hypothetical protein
MIHEGERNRRQKLKLISDLEKWSKKDNIRLSKRKIILFTCDECGYRIGYEPKKNKTKTAYMMSHYDNYLVWFEKDPNFIPFDNNYKNAYTNWSSWCNKICLNCGSHIETDEINCNRCKNTNIVLGKELGGKPCPVCGTALNVGIFLQGFEAYTEKKSELDDKWFKIYRERYNVKKPMPPNYTKEEIKENERYETLITKYSQDDKYIFDNVHNALRFVFKDAWMSGFYCILEWDDNLDGILSFFRSFDRKLIEKKIEYYDITKVTDLLSQYDYFHKRFFKNDNSIKLDGYTFGLEVKIGEKYKELCIWGIENGILYDIGMLLLKMAGKTFKELYEYAW